MTMTSSSTSTDLSLIEVKPGMTGSFASLKAMLPDVETALFFGKVFELDYRQLSNLIYTLFQSNLVNELRSGAHSVDLQDYVVDLAHEGYFNEGDVVLKPDVPHGEILPAMWDSIEVTVAKSIKDVATKLEGVVDRLPGKNGQMVFRSLMKMNAKRPTIGDYKAKIHHAPEKPNLLILDVSGSMTSATIQAIVEDVVALSYKANAHLAIVSNSCTYWEPGTYDVTSVLAAAEFGGTQYEELSEVLDVDWGVVITVADYDSSRGAKARLAMCKGKIDEVLDISLVNRPTFLAECVGQLATKVTPILVAPTHYVLNA